MYNSRGGPCHIGTYEPSHVACMHNSLPYVPPCRAWMPKPGLLLAEGGLERFRRPSPVEAHCNGWRVQKGSGGSACCTVRGGIVCQGGARWGAGLFTQRPRLLPRRSPCGHSGQPTSHLGLTHQPVCQVLWHSCAEGSTRTSLAVNGGANLKLGLKTFVPAVW